VAEGLLRGNCAADKPGTRRYMNIARHVRAFGVAQAMTDRETDKNLEIRKKRILFRAWHRGTREMDLILGRFADASVGLLGERDIALLENLMDVSDADLYDWIIGAKEIPAEYETTLLKKLRSFHLDAGNAR
jgi:antitoxin CptB